MNERRSLLGMLVAGTCAALGLWTTPAPAGASEELTPQARAVVQALFPDAAVIGVQRETEGGVSYFEVDVRRGDERIEIEVTAEGAVGEIETRVALADVPQAARAGILSLCGTAE